MRNSIRHNPLNDLEVDSVDSIEVMRRSEQVIQVILQRIELRQDRPLHKLNDTVQPIMLCRVEHRDVQDEAQD